MKKLPLTVLLTALLSMIGPAEAQPMKKLVVFYSHWGSTRMVAQAIAAETGADLLEVKPKRDLPAGRFWAVLLGGKMATFNERPELLPLDRNPADYDLLFIGTPVWAGKPSAPIAAFIEKVPLKGKKIAFFCTFDGNPGGTMKRMQQALKGNEIVGELGAKRPKDDPEANSQQARAWAKKVLDKAAGRLAG